MCVIMGVRVTMYYKMFCQNIVLLKRRLLYPDSEPVLQYVVSYILNMSVLALTSERFCMYFLTQIQSF